MNRPTKIQFFEGRDEKWYVHVRAANGQIRLPSQGYSTRAHARREGKWLAGLLGGLVVLEEIQMEEGP